MIKKRIATLLLLALYLINFSVLAFANESEDAAIRVETAPSDRDVEIEFLTKQPTNDHVVCFDVNEDGMLAVGTSESNNKTVCVFDASGDFQYGYRFVSFGSYYLDWADEKLVLCLVRSSLAVTVDSLGMVARVVEIKDTKSNDRYWSFLQSNTRIVNGEKYIMRSSKIQKVDAAGEKKTLYKVSPLYTIKRIIIIAAIVAAVVGGVCVWFRRVHEIIQNNRKNTGDGSLVP